LFESTKIYQFTHSDKIGAAEFRYVNLVAFMGFGQAYLPYFLLFKMSKNALSSKGYAVFFIRQAKKNLT